MGFLVFLGVIALIVFVLVGIYNRLVALRQNRNNAFSDIEVQLKQRYDLVPQLVETVKGYAAHEKGVFEAVTNARAGIAQSHGTDQRIEAEKKLGGALMTLFAVAENYPQLKANQNFLDLQAQLEGTENRIGAARNDYNESVKDFNISVRKFPLNIFAGMFKMGTRPTFEADAAAQKAPNVQF